MQANSIRISYWLRGIADTDEANPWIVTWWLKPQSPPLSTTDFETYFDSSIPGGLYAVWHNSFTATAGGTAGLRFALPLGIRWYYTEVAARLAMSPGDADHVSVFAPAATAAFVGNRSGTMAPAPLAAVLQKRTSTGSRRQWGRNYLPCNGSDVEIDGRMTGAAATIPTPIIGILGASGVGYSLWHHVVHNSDGLSRTINDASLGTYVGVQRRRLR